MNNIEEEISLKDVFLKIKKNIFFLLTKWKVIIVWASVFAILGCAISTFIKPKYIANTSLILQSESSTNSMISGALALASQFGFSAGGSTNEEDKLVDIILSKKIVLSALLSNATINQKNDFLINHYLEIYGYREDFDNDETLKFLSYKDSEPSNFSHLQDSVFNELYKKIIDKGRLSIDKDKESNIITITTETESEEFSKYFNENIITSVADFYVSNITKNAIVTANAVKKSADSTYQALIAAQDKYAKWKDASSRLIKMQGSIEEMKLQQNIQALTAIYIEKVKNLEIAKFAVLNQTPVLEIIDKPSLSLEKKEIKMIIAVPIGFILGIFLSSFYLVFKKFISGAMNNTK